MDPHALTKELINGILKFAEFLITQKVCRGTGPIFFLFYIQIQEYVRVLVTLIILTYFKSLTKISICILVTEGSKVFYASKATTSGYMKAKL